MLCAAVGLLAAVDADLDAQSPRPRTPVERIADSVYRIGALRVDTSKREVTVPGRINNNVSILE